MWRLRKCSQRARPGGAIGERSLSETGYSSLVPPGRSSDTCQEPWFSAAFAKKETSRSPGLEVRRIYNCGLTGTYIFA